MKRILSLTVLTVLASTSQYSYADQDTIDAAEKVTAQRHKPMLKAKERVKEQQIARTRAVDSPFEACKDKVFLSHDDYAKQKSYWDDVLKDCGSEGVELLPDVGFTVSEIKNAADSISFLQEVGSKALKTLDANIAHMEKVKDCFARSDAAASVSETLIDLRNKAFGKNCAEVKNDVKKLIAEVQPKARHALAIMGGLDPKAIFDGDSKTAVNGRLHIPSTIDLASKELGKGVSTSIYPEDIAPYVFGEREDAATAAMKVAKSLEEKVKAKELTAYQGLEQYYKWKEEVRGEYISLLQKAPILAYLGTTKIDGKEGDYALLNATKKLLENAKKERAQMAKTIENGKLDYSVSGRSGSNQRARSKSDQAKSMLDFMVYVPTIEKMLKDDSKYCSTATALAQHVEKAHMRNMSGVVGATLLAGAATTLFPPSAVIGVVTTKQLLAGLVLGPILSAGFAGYDYAELQKAKQGAWTSIGSEGKDGGSIRKTEDVAEARSTLNWDVILSPTALIGTGISGATANFFKQAAAKSMLVERGVAKEEAKKLVALTRSNQKNVSVDAQKMVDAAAKDFIKAKTGLSKAEDLKKLDEITEELAAKGFLGRVSALEARHMNDVSIAIKGLEKQEGAQRKFMDGFLATLREMNGAKLNDATRTQKLKLAIAFNEFGIRDSQRAARMVNDWDEGIEGLTKTIQLATKKLNNRELASVSNLAERQKLAWEAAVDEQVSKSPYYREAPAAARDEARAEMKTKCNALF